MDIMHSGNDYKFKVNLRRDPFPLNIMLFEAPIVISHVIVVKTPISRENFYLVFKLDGWYIYFRQRVQN